MSYTPDKTVAYISIHALRVEGDLVYAFCSLFRSYFYPRPPGGGRPPKVSPSLLPQFNFYPRPPGGGRQRIHP